MTQQLRLLLPAESPEANLPLNSGTDLGWVGACLRAGSLVMDVRTRVWPATCHFYPLGNGRSKVFGTCDAREMRASQDPAEKSFPDAPKLPCRVRPACPATLVPMLGTSFSWTQGSCQWTRSRRFLEVWNRAQHCTPESKETHPRSGQPLSPTNTKRSFNKTSVCPRLWW